MRGKGEGMSLVGRELCLTAAQHVVLWQEIVHVPGTANLLDDVLSRPEYAERFAAVLACLDGRGAQRLVLEPRVAELHWRSRVAPTVSALPTC